MVNVTLAGLMLRWLVDRDRVAWSMVLDWRQDHPKEWDRFVTAVREHPLLAWAVEWAPADNDDIWRWIDDHAHVDGPIPWTDSYKAMVDLCQQSLGKA